MQSLLHPIHLLLSDFDHLYNYDDEQAKNIILSPMHEISYIHKTINSIGLKNALLILVKTTHLKIKEIIDQLIVTLSLFKDLLQKTRKLSESIVKPSLNLIGLYLLVFRSANTL